VPARILVIEDNPENLDLMTYLLTAFGHTAMRAMDGEQGLQLALREKPDLILCDLQMPRVDGFEVARRVRENPQLSQVPLVAVTAYAMRDDRDKVMTAGFDGYITKPIVPEEFVTRTERFLSAELRSMARPPATGSQPESPKPSQQNTRATVLAVDDRPVNLNLVQSTLEPSGYKVIAVETVQEALRVAKQDPPDLILSDVHLPKEGGFEFLEAVRRDPDLKALPFILMSSTVSDAGAAKSAMALGATRILFRPLEPEVLLREVEACLARQGGD
jgi:two-component system, cell cycle response regulator